MYPNVESISHPSAMLECQMHWPIHKPHSPTISVFMRNMIKTIPPFPKILLAIIRFCPLLDSILQILSHPFLRYLLQTICPTPSLLNILTRKLIIQIRYIYDRPRKCHSIKIWPTMQIILAYRKASLRTLLIMTLRNWIP